MTQRKKSTRLKISSQVCGNSESVSLMGARENLLPLLGISPTSGALPRLPGSPRGAQLTGDFSPTINILSPGPAPKSSEAEIQFEIDPRPQGNACGQLNQSHPYSPPSCAFLDGGGRQGHAPPCILEKPELTWGWGPSWVSLNSPPTAWKASVS